MWLLILSSSTFSKFPQSRSLQAAPSIQTAPSMKTALAQDKPLSSVLAQTGTVDFKITMQITCPTKIIIPMSSCLVFLLPSLNQHQQQQQWRMSVTTTALHYSAVHSSYPLSTIYFVLSARSEGNGGFVDTLVLTAFFLQRQHRTLSPSTLTHALPSYTFLTITKTFQSRFQAFDLLQSGLLPSCGGVDSLVKATEQLGASTWIPQHLHSTCDKSFKHWNLVFKLFLVLRQIASVQTRLLWTCSVVAGQRCHYRSVYCTCALHSLLQLYTMHLKLPLCTLVSFLLSPFLGSCCHFQSCLQGKMQEATV